MATAAASELTAQPEPSGPQMSECSPRGEPVKLSKSATQRRIDKLIRAGHDKDRQIVELERENSELEQENKQLTNALQRALSLAERYRKLRPITPNLDRYPGMEKK